jgi:ureidoglycolate hydrolase
MVYKIALKNITRENFSEFGQYLDESGSIPTFSGPAFDWWNAVGILDMKGKISLGVVKPNFMPDFSEQVFEQHNNTQEVLIPIDDDVILLLGTTNAFQDEIPSEDAFEAFRVPKGTVVSLNPGVWHHAPMTLKGSVRTLVLFRENTSFEDIVIQDLKKSGLIVKVILG